MSLRRVLAVTLVVLTACPDEAMKGGSAVGLHARVRAGGAELVSAEAEVRLDPPGAAEPVTPRSAAAVLRPRLEGPHRHAGGVAPARASWAARTPPATAACGVGEPAEKIATIDGALCWVSTSLTSGSLIEENALYEFVLLGRDGIYKATQVSANVYYPPDFGHFGVNAAVGCAKSPDGDFITREYLASMSAFAVAYSLGPSIVGFTAFIVPSRGFVPAIEYDSGYGLTASLIPWPIGISLNLMEKSNYTTPPTLIIPWNDSCGAPAPGAGFRAGEGDTLATIAAGLRGLQSAPGDDNIAVLQREMAASLLPVFEMLSAPTGGAPTDDAPAATQADLFTDWLARGDGQQLCADCPATSIDHLLYELDRQVKAAGDDSDAILLAGIEGADRQVQLSPQLLEQANLQRQLAPGVALAGVIADEVIAGGDPGRFVDARVVVVPAQLGVAAELSIGADEIAELIGVDAAALAGATVTLDASPVVEPASFTLTDGEVQASYTPQDPAPVLFRYTVDLSTAVGPLPAGAADWVVRPAMRRMQPASGPPARVLLTAPYRAPVDAPVVLSAMVLDADYSPVTGPLTVDFLDGEGALLASAEGQRGAATASVVPSPSIPVISAVKPTTLQYGDDSTGPGFVVTGTGFSREASVRVDGVSLTERGLIVAVISSREILFEDDGEFAGEHRVVVENPHATGSNTGRFTGP